MHSKLIVNVVLYCLFKLGTFLITILIFLTHQDDDGIGTVTWRHFWNFDGWYTVPSVYDWQVVGGKHGSSTNRQLSPWSVEYSKYKKLARFIEYMFRQAMTSSNCTMYVGPTWTGFVSMYRISLDWYGSIKLQRKLYKDSISLRGKVFYWYFLYRAIFKT